jgi:phosphatidylglycerophosphate synthase
MSSSKPSIAELRAVAQPPELFARYSGEHWAGRLYGRRVSIYVTWFLLRTPLSANAITVLMALVGAAGAGLFSQRGLWWGVLGAVLIQVYLILDCSDGEVARWQGKTGATGIFLDRLGHFLVESTLFMAMGVRAGWPHTGDGVAFFSESHSLEVSWMALGLLAAVLHVFGKVETDLVHVARAKAGLPPVVDDASTAAPSGGLGAARRFARLFPFYRLTGAVEASLIALLVVIVDHIQGGELDWTYGFVWGAVVVTALVFVGHLVMILASNRLRA